MLHIGHNTNNRKRRTKTANLSVNQNFNNQIEIEDIDNRQHESQNAIDNKSQNISITTYRAMMNDEEMCCVGVFFFLRVAFGKEW